MLKHTRHQSHRGFLTLGCTLAVCALLCISSFGCQAQPKDTAQPQATTKAQAAGTQAAGTQQAMTLPQPSLNTAPGGAKSFPQIVAQRKSTRDFDTNKVIGPQVLSDLLYCAWGVTRPDGKRSIPTAMNKQELEVYAIMASGVWRYDGPSHTLQLIDKNDIRCGQFATAPLTLAYAAPDTTITEMQVAGMHVGSSYQSTGLYAASVGLGNVVAISPVSAYAEKLQLPQGYKLLAVQAFGWPK